MKLHYELEYKTVKKDKACYIYLIFQYSHTGLPKFHKSRRHLSQ